MRNMGNLKVSTKGDCEVVMTRVFAAPRHLVWDAWTKPELLKRWLYGPPKWSLAVCDMDLRPGGSLRWVWRGEDGTEMGLSGTYREIVPHERIVHTELFDEDWTGGETVVTVIFSEEVGKTTVTMTVLYSSREARDAALKTGMDDGLAMGYDRLESMVTGTRKIGDFCWINMLTPEPAAAREFFGKLLGWTYAEIPGLGHLTQVGGKPFGGLFDLHAPNTPEGIPPCIGVMVKVVSADATAAKVVELGGQTKATFDVMNNLRMSVCFDPNGANFDLFEPKEQHGTGVDSTLHGAPSWFETMTTDVDRAAKFYAELFNWTPEAMPMPGFTYTTFKLDGEYVAGMMQLTPDMGNIPPHWAVYFTVSNVDETARLAGELGAKLCVPPQDIPNVGRFCGITSPQGVTFLVITYTR